MCHSPVVLRRLHAPPSLEEAEIAATFQPDSPPECPAHLHGPTVDESAILEPAGLLRGLRSNFNHILGTSRCVEAVPFTLSRPVLTTSSSAARKARASVLVAPGAFTTRCVSDLDMAGPMSSRRRCKVDRCAWASARENLTDGICCRRSGARGIGTVANLAESMEFWAFNMGLERSTVWQGGFAARAAAARHFDGSASMLSSLEL